MAWRKSSGVSAVDEAAGDSPSAGIYSGTFVLGGGAPSTSPKSPAPGKFAGKFASSSRVSAAEQPARPVQQHTLPASKPTVWDGEYDEAAQAAEFQQAVLAWRQGGSEAAAPAPAPSRAVATTAVQQTADAVPRLSASAAAALGLGTDEASEQQHRDSYALLFAGQGEAGTAAFQARIKAQFDSRRAALRAEAEAREPPAAAGASTSHPAQAERPRPPAASREGSRNGSSGDHDHDGDDESASSVQHAAALGELQLPVELMQPRPTSRASVAGAAPITEQAAPPASAARANPPRSQVTARNVWAAHIEF